MPARLLTASDRDATLAYLEAKVAERMFLASNLLKYGIEDRGGMLQGPFYGSFAGRALRGVVQLVNQGSVLCCGDGPAAMAELGEAAAATPHLPARVLAMRQECEDYLAAYLARRPRRIRDTRDSILQQVTAETLVHHPMKGFRAATSDDVDLLVRWKREFRIDGLKDKPEWVDDGELRRFIELAVREGRQYVLEEGGRPVTMGLVNASTPRCAQLGGVYTPPEERGKGYATRMVSAMCHFQLSACGLQAVFLSVEADSHAANHIYAKLGFRHLGIYRFLLLEPAPAG